MKQCICINHEQYQVFNMLHCVLALLSGCSLPLRGTNKPLNTQLAVVMVCNHASWLLVASPPAPSPLCTHTAISDPEGLDMYYIMGRQPKTGLITIRAKRGSNKNEAVNKQISAAVMTTGKMRPDLAHGE